MATLPSAWSFRVLLFLQGALLAFAPLLIVALTGWWLVVPQLRGEIERDLESTTHAAAVQIDTHLASARRELVSLATLIELEDADYAVAVGGPARRSSPERLTSKTNRAADATRMLDTVVGQGGLYEAIYLARKDGIVVALGLPVPRRMARPDMLGVDLSRREFVQEALRSGEMTWSSAFLSAVSGRLTVGLAVPVKRGVLVAELALGQLSYFLRDLPLVPSATAFVVDRRGQVVAHPRPELAGQQISVSEQSLIRDGFAQGRSFGSFQHEGRPIVGSSRTIAGVGWLVMVGQPMSSAYRVIESVSIVMLIGLGVAVLWSVLLAFALAAGTARRLAAYARNAGELANGRYELSWPTTRVRELIGLGDDLRRMASAIKLREDELRDSQGRYREVVQNSADLITRVDAAGRFVFVNQTAERIFGLPPEACIGRSAFEFIHPDDRSSSEAAFARWLASYAETLQFENRQVDVNGNVFTLVWSIHVHRNAAGEVVEFSSIGHDVTERRLAEAEIRRLALVARATSSAVLIADPEGRVEWVNSACESNTGFSLSELKGQLPWVLRVATETDSALLSWMSSEMSAGHGFSGVEFAVGKKNGQTGWVEIEVQPVRNLQGALVQFVVIESDIIARRDAQIALKASEERLQQLNATLELRVDERTEALAAANEELREAVATLQRAQDELIRAEKLAALGALVAGIAHELNTPIGNGLMAASTLEDHAREFATALNEGSLKRSALDRFVRDVGTATAIVVRNMHKASELVTSFKQVAVDQTSAQRRSFGLEELVSEIILTLRPTFKKTPFVVNYSVPAELALDSYPGPLGQVLANLLNNAILHGFEGRDHGVVEIRAQSLAGHRIRIEVSDNGGGIRPENLSRIFDPFFTTKLGKGGSGLGLHIVHNIVTHILGGEVSVQSSSSGTSFTLEIPQKAPDVSVS